MKVLVNWCDTVKFNSVYHPTKREREGSANVENAIKSFAMHFLFKEIPKFEVSLP